MPPQVSAPITLPSGATLTNRFVKSAMSENMARNFKPGGEFVNAYRMWVDGGAGLLISGNVMVDSRHLGEPHNVVIEEGFDNTKDLKEWASVADGSTSQIWLQLNHPGKQTPKFLTKEPVAPSAVPFSGSLKSSFNTPRELSTSEIKDIVSRFAYAAKLAKECGFGGVQIHGAHGYLVSQFLSPHHNQRTDEYGGSIENRVRFLTEVYDAMREAVGSDFSIGIKMNSADFSKGGFSNEDAVFVAKTLSDRNIDLIEISGGTYEAPAMTGVMKESTKRREAYFLEYTKELRKVIRCPLMVTGGFRTASFIEEVLGKGELDLIGLARPLALDPSFPNKVLEGQDAVSLVEPVTSGFKKVDRMFPLEIIWYTNQIHSMGRNRRPNPKAGVFPVIFKTIKEAGTAGLKRLRASN